MGFWVFMLVVVLLTPGIMLGAGWWFRKSPPKSINHWIGYRTERSMKNRETWAFAHRYCGRLWIRLGLGMLPLAVVPMLLVLGKPEEAVATVGLVLAMLQAAVLLGSIVPTERALEKRFDQNGNPK